MIKTREYAPSKSTYRKLVRKELLKNARIFVFLTVVAFTGVASISVYGFMYLGNNKILEAWTPFLLVVTFFWLYMLGYMPYRSSNSQINRLSFIEWQYTFDEKSFRAASNEGHEILAKYSSIPKTSIDSDYFMVYFNAYFALLVPKEAFCKETDFYEVIKYF